MPHQQGVQQAGMLRLVLLPVRVRLDSGGEIWKDAWSFVVEL